MSFFTPQDSGSRAPAIPASMHPDPSSTLFPELFSDEVDIDKYVHFIYALIAAEVTRRLVLLLKNAYTGPLSRVPGPWWGKFTNLPWMISRVTGNSMNLLPKLLDKYREVLRVAPNDIIFAGKDAVQKVLIDEDFVKAPVYDDIEMYPGIKSLITERDKSLYKSKRRLLAPGFSIAFLNGLEPLMHNCVQEFETFLDTQCSQNLTDFTVIEMSRALSNLTFDIMAATSFGGSFNLTRTNDSTIKSIFLNRLKRAAIDSQFPFVKFLPFLPPAMSKEFNELIDRILSTRRSYMAKNPDKPKKDLLQMFIDTHDADPAAFNSLHMREEMALFMVAGSDTSSTTLTFTLLLLVENLDKLAKLKQELDEAFPDKEDEITFVGTQDLPYLNAVINESMRVMPIGTVALTRYTTETSHIGGYEIPPKTIISAAISALLHNLSIYPNPNIFLPERWLAPYQGVPIDKKAYHPFSAGSRNCIGQQFAMKELRLIVATLVRRWEVQEVKGQKEMKVHTVPWFVHGGYKVGIKRRKD